VKERPILFSGAMVRAILEGQKTQTRVVVAPSNCHFGSAPAEFWKHADFSSAWRDGQKGEFRGDKYVVTGRGDGEYIHVPCHVKKEGECERCSHWGWTGTSHRLWPNFGAAHTWVQESEADYTPPASRLWVRETWRETGSAQMADGSIPRSGTVAQVVYRANKCDHEGPWRSSIHMPRWASRITLEILKVRVERVQDISEDDAYAEGVTDTWPLDNLPYLSGHGGRAVLNNYAHLWDKINAKRGFGWDANPWVWVIDFGTLKRARNTATL